MGAIISIFHECITGVKRLIFLLHKIKLIWYSKTCLKQPLKRPIIGFQDRLSLNAGQKYCRMLQESILQYFRPSLSYNLSLRPLFCLFLSGHLRQVLLYLPRKCQFSFYFMIKGELLKAKPYFFPDCLLYKV